MIKNLLLRSVFLCLTSLVACTQGPQTPDSREEVLVSISNHNLTRADLQRMMNSSPGNSIDSVRQARALIRSWINRSLLLEMAEKSVLNMEDIDRLVEDYRSELISDSFFAQYYAANGGEAVSADSISAYYNKNKERFRLERPIVKGIFVRVPAGNKKLKEIKRLIDSQRTDDIDRLEKLVYDPEIQYEYFRDRWIDSELLELHVPAITSDEFQSKRNIELTDEEYVYLISLTDIRKAGEIMPEEFAEEPVRRAIEFEQRTLLERNLQRDLLKQAEQKGIIKINCEF